MEQETEWKSKLEKRRGENRLLWGICLLVVGIVILAIDLYYGTFAAPIGLFFVGLAGGIACILFGYRILHRLRIWSKEV